MKVAVFFKVQQMENGIADQPVAKIIAVKDFFHDLRNHMGVVGAAVFRHHNQRQIGCFRGLDHLFIKSGHNRAHIEYDQSRMAVSSHLLYNLALLGDIVSDRKETSQKKLTFIVGISRHFFGRGSF